MKFLPNYTSKLQDENRLKWKDLKIVFKRITCNSFSLTKFQPNTKICYFGFGCN